MNDPEEDDRGDDEPPWWVQRGYVLEAVPNTSAAGMTGPVAVACSSTWEWGMSQRHARQCQTFTGRWRNET